MDLFQWEKKYEVGLAKIDSQHRTLVDMLNKLYAAKKTDQAKRVIERTLERLLQYTKTHFADEETAMRDANYPFLEHHHIEHLNLQDKVLALQGTEPVTFELLSFLSEWLKFHICESDRQFGSFVRQQEVAARIAAEADSHSA